MAEQKEKLIVELEARVDAFNRDLTNAQRKQSQALGDINRRMDLYTKTASNSTSTTMGLARGMAGLAASIGAAAAATKFLNDSVQASRNFEQAISDLSAITGATGEDLEFLSEASKRFGATTTLSATQSAEAFKLIASAKPDLLQNAEALARVTREAITLSEATGVDLASSARTLGSALNQFSADADESTRFINVMAEGSRLGAASVDEISESLKNGGLAAAESGLSFEQTNAILQTFSTVGLKGSEAGTALRSVMVSLEKTGNRELTPSIVGLNKALENLDKMNLDTTASVKMFGQEHFQAAGILVKNREQIASLTKDLTGTNAAYEQAATRVDNLSGDMTALGSAYEGLQIRVGDLLTETLGLRDGTQSLTEGIQEFISAGGGMETVEQLFQDISDRVVDAIDYISVYVDQWKKAFSGVGDGLSKLTSSFSEEINMVAGFLQELFEFFSKTFLSIPSKLGAVFESSLNAIRLIVTEAGLLILGLAESLQELPLVGDSIKESIGETIKGVKELLEETAAADRAAIESAFAKADAVAEAAWQEVESKREAREAEREQREEEEEAERERKAEIDKKLKEMEEGKKDKEKSAKEKEKKEKDKADKEEIKSNKDKNKITLSDTLRTLEASTSAASGASETVHKINVAAGAASTLISTPAAIMKAYEQLGPVGGSIAAVGIAAAGFEALNQIRSVTLGGGGGSSGTSSGPDVGSAIDANNEASGIGASIEVSDTVSGSGGLNSGVGSVRANNTDELGEAMVNYLNRAIKNGQVELNS